MHHLTLQILTAWLAARERLDAALERAGDERGELTGNVILLAALAAAAVAAGAVIVAKISSAANSIP